MIAIHARTALTSLGWRDDVRVVVSARGTIAAVEAGAAAQPDDSRADILLPAMPNVHSHAFQRGMAGLAETRGPGADTFWTWREVMYRFALTMSPDDVEAVAAQLYVEMLESGFCRIGEFHYLHHDRDGGAYANIAEMCERIASAAETTGMALTLLPVFYAHSTFGGAAPHEGQRRFINNSERFGRIMEGARNIAGRLPGTTVGVAPHSLRAVTPEELADVVPLANGGPVHIHAAEQVKEVEDCLAWSGRRPVEWLLDHAKLDRRWCLIHATHMTDAEATALARSGAVAGLCPVTEANLGDGIFPGRQFIEAGGAFGIGSDSNVLIGVADELRQLEYAQRLGMRQRNVIAPPGGSTGRDLFDRARHGGSQSLGVAAPEIASGASADLLSLDSDHPTLAGKTGDAILDAWIFAGGANVDSVWVGGHRVVSEGRHQARETIAERFKAAMTRLSAT
ncbi:MAG: formimidoylglutamate deiminase [Rhizobiaceae bacterium]